jgi:PAS domain S-box-containing protein
MADEGSLTAPPDHSSVAFNDIVDSSRVIAETASDAIITINERSQILFVNRATTHIFGYPIEELLGAELTMLMPEYLRHVHRSGLKNYLETGKKHVAWDSVRLPGRHKDGHEITLELSFGEFQRDGQRFFTGIARDITERERVEKRLAALQKVTDSALAHLSLDDLLSESLKRIREVLNVDTVAILLLRTEGDELVAWAARGLEEQVELGVRIPVGSGFAGNIIATGQPIIIDDVSQADIYNPLLLQKGIKSLLGVPLFVEGRPTGVLHVGKLQSADFNEEDVRLLQLVADRIALAIENARLYEVEKTARAMAEDANRAKDEFLTILSHELRTPLTPIIGWGHMMGTGILPAADFGKALEVINRNANNLKRLVNDLLDMSAILSGKMRIERARLPLAEVLKESVDTMRPYAEQSKVELHLKIGSDASSLMIAGDRSRLNQAFCNVLHNAIKFSPAGGAIKVTCEINDCEVAIRFKDYGEGITREFLPYVFERFRQADGTRTRAYGGLGLGLALVKSFVEAHDGSVEADSEGQGQGSVFVIKLPREVPSPQETLESQVKSEPDEARNRKRILIVEDQPDTLEMLAASFQAKGYEPLLSNSAAEALQIAGHEHFDLLISDIAMPDMDGLQLIRDLRRREGMDTIPAIALTGYASQKDVDAAIAAGFNLHLTKPIDPVDLTTAVEQLLAQVMSDLNT